MKDPIETMLLALDTEKAIENNPTISTLDCFVGDRRQDMEERLTLMQLRDDVEKMLKQPIYLDNL